MEWVHVITLLSVLAALVTIRVMGLNESAQRFAEALKNFRGGGPPSPMHPIPSNDGALLLRRSRKIEK